MPGSSFCACTPLRPTAEWVLSRSDVTMTVSTSIASSARAAAVSAPSADVANNTHFKVRRMETVIGNPLVSNQGFVGPPEYGKETVAHHFCEMLRLRTAGRAAVCHHPVELCA